ncbi:MAG: hypothetical protein AAGF26_10030 [Cyanobacteria bacterium P01_G01_bin.49]
MKTFTKLFIGAILCFTWSASAKAALISVNDTVFGADSITRDTDTNLEWLDVPFSQGRTFIDVSGEFGLGGDFEGFRSANAAEFETLVLNSGIPGINTTVTGDLTSFTNLIDLLGVTSFQDSNPQTSGFLSNSAGSQLRINGDLDFSLSNGTPAYEANTSISRNETLLFPNVGHYLVRSIPAIPEPSSSLGFLAFSILGSGLTLKRKLKSSKSSEKK